MLPDFLSNGFVPRRVCGDWTDYLIVTDNVGNLSVFVAYVLIPLILYDGYRGLRKLLPEPDGDPTHPLVGFPRWAIPAFITFILSCGIGHLWAVWVFYEAAYRLFVPWTFLTGAASFWGVVQARLAVWWLKDKFLALQHERERMVVELRDENRQRLKTEKDLKDLVASVYNQKRGMAVEIDKLRDQVKRLQEKAASGHDGWRTSLDEDINAIRLQLHNLRDRV